MLKALLLPLKDVTRRTIGVYTCLIIAFLGSPYADGSEVEGFQ